MGDDRRVAGTASGSWQAAALPLSNKAETPRTLYKRTQDIDKCCHVQQITAPRRTAGCCHLAI